MYGQSLQRQYFFIFPLMVFTTGDWKKWSMSRRLSSRDGASSSIGWTLTSTRSPSSSTSFGFPSDARVCLAVTAYKFRTEQCFLNNYAPVVDLLSSSTSSSPLASSSLVIVRFLCESLVAPSVIRRFLAAAQVIQNLIWNTKKTKTYAVWAGRRYPRLLRTRCK